MKKSSLIILLFLLVFPITSAITTTLAPVYQPSETIIIKIEGNILEPLSPSDVVFKRNHVAVAVNYDLKKIGDTYYLYAQAPLNKNNYTLFINDVSTTVNGQMTTLDFNQSFRVDGNITDYWINPGFAVVNQGNLEFTITLNTDTAMSIMTDFPDSQSITLTPGSNMISLSTVGKSSGFYQAVIGKYTIPLQIINSQIPQNQTQAELFILPRVVNRVVLSNSNYTFNISLLNNGSSNIQNIRISFNESVFNISPEIIESLNPGEGKQISVSLLKKSGVIKEDILFYNSNQELGNLEVNISFTSNSTMTSVENESVGAYYCSELSGIFCAANEMCSTDPIQSLDGLCCTGTCAVEEESSFGWIGYISIALIILILIFVFFKYKKSAVPKPKTSSLINPLAKKI